MNIPLWVSELAAAFWEQAGGEEPFPRDLRRGIALEPARKQYVNHPELSVKAEWRKPASENP
jgi:hypothetical protein